MKRKIMSSRRIDKSCFDFRHRQNIFSFPSRPEWIWAHITPPLNNGYRNRRVKYPVLKSNASIQCWSEEWSELYLHSVVCPHVADRDNFTNHEDSYYAISSSSYCVLAVYVRYSAVHPSGEGSQYHPDAQPWWEFDALQPLPKSNF